MGAAAFCILVTIVVCAVLSKADAGPNTMQEWALVQDPVDAAAAQAFAAVADAADATDPTGLQPACRELVTRTKAALDGPRAPDAPLERARHEVLTTMVAIGRECSAGTTAGLRRAILLIDQMGPAVDDWQARVQALSGYRP